MSFGFRGAVLAATLLGAASAASAQTARTTTVQAGKTIRMAVVTGLKKDCSLGQPGGIRIITTPKSGQLAVEGGKTKTPASFRCPNVETPIQQLLYKAKPGFTGTDEIAYETRTPEGETQSFTVKITVTDKAPASGSKGGLVDL